MLVAAFSIFTVLAFLKQYEIVNWIDGNPNPFEVFLGVPAAVVLWRFIEFCHNSVAHYDRDEKI